MSAAADAVRLIHYPSKGTMPPFCRGCHEDWPCATERALRRLPSAHAVGGVLVEVAAALAIADRIRTITTDHAPTERIYIKALSHIIDEATDQEEDQ